MPTHAEEPEFWVDYFKLSLDDRAAFRRGVQKLAHDLKIGVFRKGLRVKRVQGRSGVWEMTWANDGRATFEYGESVRPGYPHVIWRRVGSHDILENP